MLRTWGSTIFIYALGIIFAGVIAFQIIRAITPISMIATSYVSVVIGYAVNTRGSESGANLTTLGVNQGVSLSKQPQNEKQTQGNSDRITALESKT